VAVAPEVPTTEVISTKVQQLQSSLSSIIDVLLQLREQSEHTDINLAHLETGLDGVKSKVDNTASYLRDHVIKLHGYNGKLLCLQHNSISALSAATNTIIGSMQRTEETGRRVDLDQADHLKELLQQIQVCFEEMTGNNDHSEGEEDEEDGADNDEDSHQGGHDDEDEKHSQEGEHGDADEEQDGNSGTYIQAVTWYDSDEDEEHKDTNFPCNTKTTTTSLYCNEIVGLGVSHETSKDGEPSDGVNQTHTTNRNNNLNMQAQGDAAVTVDSDIEDSPSVKEIQITKVVQPKVYTEPNLLTPQEMAQMLSSMCDGDAKALAILIKDMKKSKVRTIKGNPQIEGIVITYFDKDMEKFGEVWHETVRSLNEAMKGKGLLRGGASMPQTGSSMRAPTAPVPPEPPSSMGTLLQKIVDPPTFNQIVRLPRDQQPVATVMAYCKFLGFPFDALVPNPEQFEGQFEEGTAEHRQIKLQRQAEIRQLSLTLTQQVKEAIEKEEKGGVVAKSSYVSPPSLNGSDPFFPHRTYAAKARDF